MHGKGQGAAHAQYGPEGVGTRTQMGYLAQKLQRVAFFLQGILLRVGGAVYLDGIGLHLDGLALALRLDQAAGHVERGAGGDAAQLLVGKAGHVEYYLEIVDGAAVVESHKLHVLVAAAGTHPAAHVDLGTHRSGGHQGRYLAAFHAFCHYTVTRMLPS